MLDGQLNRFALIHDSSFVGGIVRDRVPEGKLDARASWLFNPNAIGVGAMREIAGRSHESPTRWRWG